ncbi:MAG: DUF3575 domain-containing protein [Sphingobacteriales bacterium]|nr:DUF3575 domain-containing protein [Sphingobacteriales bacterium]
MKIRILFILLALNTGVFAQRVTREVERTGEWNVIKVNLSALTTGTFSFQYERALNNHVSLALGAKFRPSAGLPFKSTIKSFLDTLSDGVAIDFVNNARVGGYAISPEIRFYLGKGSMHGFYIAPFLRYEKNNLDNWRYTFNSPTKTIIIDFTGNQNGVGAGIQLGAHYLLSQKISLDIWLAGPYVFSNKLNVNSLTDLSDKTDQELQDVKNDIEKYVKDYLPGHTVSATVTKTGANATAKGTFYGARVLGFALGYRF